MVDRDLFKPVETGLHLLSALKQLHPEFAFNDPTYDKRPHFDLLAGSDKMRQWIMDEKPVDEILGAWGGECERYLVEREKHLFYD